METSSKHIRELSIRISELSIRDSQTEIEFPGCISVARLDKNMASLISRYLSNKDLMNVCLSSKKFLSIFYSSFENRLISLFFSSVFEGRLDKVKEI